MLSIHTGGGLASAPLPHSVSYHSPANAVAMVSRKSTVPADRERERARHHQRLESVFFIFLPEFLFITQASNDPQVFHKPLCNLNLEAEKEMTAQN